MVSAFTSREFGFGYDLTEVQLQQVNVHRKGKHYCDKKVAIEKLGQTLKQGLKTSPFKRFIQYGNMNEGHWSYEDMIVQVEDCRDCLKAIHREAYDYLFLFDHSNGHNKLSPDTLSPTLIRKEFGGKQPHMRPSTMKDNTFLGPYHHPTKLKQGEIQLMLFQPTDDGPFYMNEKEREERHNDKITGTKTVNLTKDEMKEQLKLKGIKTPKGNKKTTKTLHNKLHQPIKSSATNTKRMG